jgi:hypothetical protein
MSTALTLILAILAILVAISVFAGPLRHREDQTPSRPTPPVVVTNPPPPDPVELPAARSDLLYGYYGNQRGQVQETFGHVNLHMTWGWGGPYNDVVTDEFMTAKTLGIKVCMLGIPGSHAADPAAAEAVTRDIFNQLQKVGALDCVKYVYPIDEPNLPIQGPKTHEQVTTVNKMIRRVAREFPELSGLKLAVIYAGGESGRPGLSGGDREGLYDAIGIDHYDAREGVLELYDDMERSMLPDQEWILVPGGADPMRQDPQEFYNYALDHPRVKIIMPFIWFDSYNKMIADGSVLNGGYSGIKSNSQHFNYVSLGRMIKGK